MWYERAQKINKQLEHLMSLVDFFEFAAVLADRLAKQHVPKLKKIVTPESQAMIGDIKRFLALYETY